MLTITHHPLKITINSKSLKSNKKMSPCLLTMSSLREAPSNSLEITLDLAPTTMVATPSLTLKTALTCPTWSTSTPLSTKPRAPSASSR